MLFKFGKGWKTLVVVLLWWSAYLLVGYELTGITLLALLLSSNFKDSHTIL